MTKPNQILSGAAGMQTMIFALVAVAIWGASPAATAVAGLSLPPELIAGLRTVLGGVILLPLAVKFRHKIPTDKRGVVELLLGGIFGFAAYPLVLSIGVLETSVAHASIILAAAPIFTGVFSFLLTKRWPKALWWVGGLVAMVGIAFLMMLRLGLDAGGTASTLEGDLLVLLSIIFASVGYVFGGRSSERIGLWPATTWSIVVGAIVFVPFTLAQALRFEWSVVGLPEVASVVFLVVFVTVVGYALWFQALAAAGAVKIAPLQFLQPIVGVILAIALLGEAFSPYFLIPMGLIILGVWVSRIGN